MATVGLNIGASASARLGGGASASAGARLSFGGSASFGLSLGASASFSLSLDALAALGNRSDPYVGFRFLVELDGVISGGFTDVSGLAAQIQTTPYREGGCNEFEHQLAGPASYPPLVLRRGITDSDELWSWHDDVCNGTIERRNGSILLCGDAGPASGLRWNFIGAYPVKWNGPTLQAATPAVAVESIEIVHQGLSRDLA